MKIEWLLSAIFDYVHEDIYFYSRSEDILFHLALVVHQNVDKVTKNESKKQNVGGEKVVLAVRNLVFKFYLFFIVSHPFSILVAYILL